MHVRKVKLRNITKYTEPTELVVPERGIVLVTGPNGAGKSTIAEAVSFGGWGKTLRGTPIAVESKKASVELDFDGGTITRERGSKSSLSWHKTGEKPTEYETTTKAQEALESVIGGHDEWKRRHVFGADGELFTTATDKARKLFLEEMAYGDAPFDAALERCRVEVRAATAAKERLTGKVLAEKAALTFRQERVTFAERALEEALAAEKVEVAEVRLTPIDEKALEEAREQAKALGKHLEASVREVNDIQRSKLSLATQAGGKMAEVEALTARLRKFGKGFCDACSQPIPAEKIDALKAEVEALKSEAQKAHALTLEERTAYDDALAEAQETLTALRKKVNAAQQQVLLLQQQRSANADALRQREAARERAAATTMRAQKAVAEAKEELEKAKKALQGMEETAAAEEKELAVITAAEQVLGLRGVRTSILARVLAGLEKATNAWLPKLVGKMRVKLRPYSEKKAGGVSDSIALDIEGAGGGHGYYGSSNGERRRIDVALMLSFLGEGTLFFDEVFDAVDAEGRPAVAAVLEEIAQTRCVFVITHNEDYARLLPSAVRWRVTEGRIE